MKVAILEASHWHVPLYLDALDADDEVSVLAVSDQARARGREVAARFGSRCYDEWQTLLQKEKPDFVFVFGRHDQLPLMARNLLDCGTPFAIEKPVGLNASDVNALAELARSRDHFVSVPLILGFSDLLDVLRQFAEGDDAWQHLAFRFIAGPIDRYVDSNCSWMLQRTVAGGGCTINLAVHFIDMFRRLTGREVTSVSARMIENRDVANVELYSLLSLENEAGQLCAVETGYTFPRGADLQREFSFSLSSSTHYLQGRDSFLRCTPRDGTSARNIDLDFETDRFYATFVRRTLSDFRSGHPPLAGLDDMAHIMAVIDGTYVSHGNGGVPAKIMQLR